MKIGYGITVASFRPFSNQANFTFVTNNSMNKQFDIITTDYPSFDRDKGKWGVMVPLKLDFNIKSKIKNLELLDLELAYRQGLSRGSKYNIAYHIITDNVTYDNVVEAKGSSWQMSVQIPFRIKRIGKKKF